MKLKNTKDYLHEFESHGLICRVLGAPFKNYNGYVAVEKNHPLWGKDEMADLFNVSNLDVHGGITFSQQGKDKSLRWPNSELWWFGFDTAHLGDYIEYSDGSHPEENGIFWTPEMVAKECEHLAEQLANLLESKKDE